MSIEPDSGVSFELHDLQFGSGIMINNMSGLGGDDKKESKIIVAAESCEQEQEPLCDNKNNIYIKKTDVKKLINDNNDLWKNPLSFQMKNYKNNQSRSSQDLVSDEYLIDNNEKDNECFGCDDVAHSEESLVEHFERLFEAKPYYGVREWL